MEELADKIGQLSTLLEDAKEESDWDVVQEVITKLDELYEDLDRRFLDEQYDVY
jgi:hypothetical protein